MHNHTLWRLVAVTGILCVFAGCMTTNFSNRVTHYRPDGSVETVEETEFQGRSGGKATTVAHTMGMSWGDPDAADNMQVGQKAEEIDTVTPLIEGFNNTVDKLIEGFLAVVVPPMP